MPAAAALESVSCLLSITKGLLYSSGGRSLDAVTIAALEVVVGQAKAALDAVWEGFDDHETITECQERQRAGEELEK